MQVAPTSLDISTDDEGSGEFRRSCSCPAGAPIAPCFATLLPLAAEGRRAVALDWRGHGESGRPDGDYGNDDLLADATSAVEGAGIDRFVPAAEAQWGGWRSNCAGAWGRAVCPASCSATGWSWDFRPNSWRRWPAYRTQIFGKRSV
jgi:hypothetical protein